MLRRGQYFPFWVNHQSVLHLKVASTEPAELVKLGIGLELAVAPRPRNRPQLLASSQEAGITPSARDVAWLRVQVFPSAVHVCLEAFAQRINVEGRRSG